MQPSEEVDEKAGDDEEAMPSFSEQMAEQLGGVRGLVESSIPITLFVIVNFLGDHFNWWPLRTSLIIAVGVAVVMAVYRLTRREPIRHAINGVFGVALGAFIALRSNDARDFYLPGILLSAGLRGRHDRVGTGAAPAGRLGLGGDGRRRRHPLARRAAADPRVRLADRAVGGRLLRQGGRADRALPGPPDRPAGRGPAGAGLAAVHPAGCVHRLARPQDHARGRSHAPE